MDSVSAASTIEYSSIPLLFPWSNGFINTSIFQWLSLDKYESCPGFTTIDSGVGKPSLRKTFLVASLSSPMANASELGPVCLKPTSSISLTVKISFPESVGINSLSQNTIDPGCLIEICRRVVSNV